MCHFPRRWSFQVQLYNVTYPNFFLYNFFFVRKLSFLSSSFRNVFGLLNFKQTRCCRFVSILFFFASQRSFFAQSFIFQYKLKQSGMSNKLICEWNARLYFSYQYAMLRQLSLSLHRESRTRTVSSIFFSWKNAIALFGWIGFVCSFAVCSSIESEEQNGIEVFGPYAMCSVCRSGNW